MAKEGAEAKEVAMGNWPSQLDSRCCYSLRHGAVKDGEWGTEIMGLILDILSLSCL